MEMELFMPLLFQMPITTQSLYGFGYTTSPTTITCLNYPLYMAIFCNQNGSYYHPGTLYDLPTKKMEVVEIYI
jgi:hypothetical protein